MSTIHEKMTAIGDAIRDKTGRSGLLTLDLMASEISSISTGVELNFKVVGGTSAPSNPTENTIWVNTDIPISSYYFSANMPFAGSIVENAGTVFGTLEGRVYSKTNGGRAAWAWVYDGAWSGCLLVSEDQNAASYSTSGNYDSVQTAGQTFVYNGKTYYYTTGAWFGGDCTSGLNPVVKGSSIEEVLEVLVKTYEAVADGTLWIQTGASSNMSFNALTKNGIQVYPIYAKQSINGEWVNKDMQIYQNGELTEATLTVVPNHTDYGSTVWKGYCTSSSSNPSISVSSTSTSMTFNAYKNNGVSAAYVPVDVTGFSRMTIAGSYTVPNSAYGANLGISVGMFASPSGSMATGYYHSGAKDDSTTTIAEKSYDISGLSGIYYFEVRATNYASSSDLVKKPTVNLTKVKFE